MVVVVGLGYPVAFDGCRWSEERELRVVCLFVCFWGEL